MNTIDQNVKDDFFLLVSIREIKRSEAFVVMYRTYAIILLNENTPIKKNVTGVCLTSSKILCIFDINLWHQGYDCHLH